MNTTPVPVLDAERTATLLGFADLVHDLEIACTELADGLIRAPDRQTLDFSQDGTMISMPATAADIGIHKLVNVMPGNARRGLPTIGGVVSVYDGQTGRPLCLLDGPTVTARRTAALSMLGLKAFLAAPPEHVTLIGSGTQASGHARALASLYPGLSLSVMARTLGQAQDFARAHSDLDLDISAVDTVADSSDVVITVTSSSVPVYNEPADARRLIVAVGAFLPEMAEIGATTLDGSHLYIDEPESGRHEAGDYLQANVNWNHVTALVDALHNDIDLSQPIVYKTVGCAAWDLAAARTALKRLNTI